VNRCIDSLFTDHDSRCIFISVCFRSRLLWESRNARHQRCDCARAKRQTVGIAPSWPSVRSAAAPYPDTPFVHPAATTRGVRFSPSRAKP